METLRESVWDNLDELPPDEVAVPAEDFESRSINWRLLWATIIIVAIAVPSLYWAHRFQLGRQSHVLLAAADRAEASGDWQAVLRYLQRYLRHNSHDSETLLRLARIVDENADTEKMRLQALMLYSRCVDRDSSRIDLKVRVAQLMEPYDPTRAVELCNEILAQDTQNESAHVVRSRSLDYLVSGTLPKTDPVLAVQAFQEWLDLDPENVEATHRLAHLKRRFAEVWAAHNETSKEAVLASADALMDELVRRQPESLEARLARFEYRMATDGPDVRRRRVFDEDLQAALDIDPDHIDVLLAAAFHFAESKDGFTIDVADLNVAKKYFERVAEQGTRGHIPYLGMAEVDWQLGDLDAALEAIRKGLEFAKGRSAWMLRYRQAQFAMEQSQYELAEQALDALQRQLPNNPWQELDGFAEQMTFAEQVLRAMWFEARDNSRRNAARARAIASEIVVDGMPDDILTGELSLHYAGLLISQSNWTVAAEALARALKADPYNFDAAFALVDVHRRIGQEDRAVTVLRRLVDELELPKTIRDVAEMELTRMYLRRELRKPKRDWDWSDVEDVLSSLKRRSPDSAATLLLEFEYEISRQGIVDREQLRGRLQAAERQFAQNVEFWGSIVELYLRLGDLDSAESAIARWEALSGRTADEQRLRLRLAQGSTPAASVASPDHQAVALAVDAETHIHRGDYLAARTSLQRLAELMVGDVQSRRYLAELALNYGDFPEVDRRIAEIRALEGDNGSLWRFISVQRTLADTNMERSERLQRASVSVTQWREAHPASPFALAAGGLVAEAAARHSEAASLYRASFRTGNQTAWNARRIMSNLILAGDTPAAWSFARLLPESLVTEPEILPLVVRLGVSQQELDWAEATARRAVAARPDVAEFHVILAQTLAAWGQDAKMAEAVQIVDQAARAAPYNPSFWIASIYFHARHEKPATHRLLSSLHHVAQLLTVHDPSLPDSWQYFVLARALELEGNLGPAERYYRWALATDRSLQVRRWLLRSSVVSEDLDATRPTLNAPSLWALGQPVYQTLALIRSVHSPQLESQQLLDGDPRWTALAELHGEDAATAVPAALAQLQQLATDQRSAGDWLLLGRLYELEATFNDAEDAFARALPYTRTTADVVEVIDFATRHRRLNLLIDAVAQLRRDSSDPGQIARYELRIALLRDPPPDTVLDIVNQRLSTLPQSLPRNVTIADFCGELVARGFAQPASQLLRQAIVEFPNHQLQFVGLLAQLPDGGDQAAEYWLRWANENPPYQAALFGLMCLQFGETSNELAGQADALIENVVAGIEGPLPKEFGLTLCRWREMQGRFDEATRLAEQLLEQNPHDAIVRNNLAWLNAAYNGSTIDALIRVEEAIRMSGPVDSFLDTRGVVLLQSGRATDAVRLFQVAALAKPMAANDYLRLASACLAEGHAARAKQLMAAIPAPELRRLGHTPYDAQVLLQTGAIPQP